MTDRVRITDVSPRDGLQNEPGVVPAGEKAELVRRLIATGVDEIEVASFVSPRAIPQLADAERVTEKLGGLPPGGPVLSALVPNERGMSRFGACAPPLGKVALFTAASETFSLRNSGATVAQTIDRFRPVVVAAMEASLPIRGYVSCAVACPFEGAIEPDAVAAVAGELLDLGVHEIDLGDTIGAGTPETIAGVIAAVVDRLERRHTNEFGGPTLTLHLHDTFGGAAACVRTAVEMGVRSFDGSAAGLGGCPYASVEGRTAPGNIATDALVRTIEEMGLTTGVDRLRLAEASAFAARIAARARVAGDASDAGARTGEGESSR